MIITKFNLVQHKSSVANPDYFILLLKDGMILIRISWGQSYKKGDTDPGAFYVNPQRQNAADPDYFIRFLKFSLKLIRIIWYKSSNSEWFYCNLYNFIQILKNKMITNADTVSLLLSTYESQIRPDSQHCVTI